MPIPPLSQEDLIELWRRILPPNYTVPIEDEQNGQGFDVPSAQALIFATADENVNETFQSHFLKPSPQFQTGDPAFGAVNAEVDITILRNASTVGEMLLDPGTRLLAEQRGSLGQTIRLIDFELVDAVTMPEGDRGPIAGRARALSEGYVGNVAAGSIEGFLDIGRSSVQPCDVLSATVVQRVAPAPAIGVTDVFHEGMIGRFASLINLPSGVQPPVKITAFFPASQSVSFTPAIPVSDIGASDVVCQIVELGDLGLEVTQAEAATGGRLAMLDAIGFDRKAGRVTGETDEQYRARLCVLADTISPAAIDRITDGILTPCGICFKIKETRNISTLKGFVWDIDPYDFGQVPAIPNNGIGDIFGEGAVWLDKSTATTFFIICVGDGNDGEFGTAYDTVAPGLDPPNAWEQFFWDGQPVGYNSCLGQLHEAIDGARAAGVNFLILRDPALTGTC